ncbi:hypothetical protein SASPL_102353 [Salvia splendens]|uniref:Uncharacterized protein n=1 Tax=Salvia splendens TaxID=180675 RepID=A0A8X8YRQ7_SALSN|nr:hypothetical protein SASPL_102353 [Salvia splendens]
MSTSKSDASQYSSSFLGSLEDEDGRFEVRSNRCFDETLETIGADSDEVHNGGVVSHPRQRPAVDYIELYNEMFGKNPTESEQISEDEDWGPTKRKRKAKETNAASTLMALGETDNKFSVETLSYLKEKQLTKKMRRPICRLPHVTVEKLRLVFSENELPERAVRVSLSEQLGLELEKSSHREGAKEMTSCEQMVQECALPSVESEKANTEEGVWDQISSRNGTAPVKSNILKGFPQQRNTHLLNHSYKIKQQRKPLLQSAIRNQMSVDLGDDVSLKHVRNKAKEAKKKLDCKSQGGMLEAQKKMKRLCEIKSRVEKLHQRLLELPCSRIGRARGNNSGQDHHHGVLEKDHDHSDLENKHLEEQGQKHNHDILENEHVEEQGQEHDHGVLENEHVEEQGQGHDHGVLENEHVEEQGQEHDYDVLENQHDHCVLENEHGQEHGYDVLENQHGHCVLENEHIEEQGWEHDHGVLENEHIEEQGWEHDHGVLENEHIEEQGWEHDHGVLENEHDRSVEHGQEHDHDVLENQHDHGGQGWEQEHGVLENEHVEEQGQEHDHDILEDEHVGRVHGGEEDERGGHVETERGDEENGRGGHEEMGHGDEEDDCDEHEEMEHGDGGGKEGKHIHVRGEEREHDGGGDA